MSAGLLLARLRKADFLYQVDELPAASECLVEIVHSCPDRVKARALARLSQIECDLGHHAIAALHVTGAEQISNRLGPNLDDIAKAEILAARSYCAIAANDDNDAEFRMHELSELALTSPRGHEIWPLVASANLNASAFQYTRQQLNAALVSCRRAERAIDRVRSPEPVVMARAQSVRAVLDMHDPERVHLACPENREHFAFALQNGMLRSARDALHNILAFSIYCDDAVGSTEASSFDETLTADLSYSIRYSGDALLRAAFEVHRGRLDTALAVIKRARSGYQGEMFAWTPEGWTPFFATFEARLLFKSGRFAEAENVAAEAARHWERARLSPGAALRVRAEALEALGRRSEAISVAYDALDALKPISPVHHLLSAYACAYRLTRQRSFAGPLSYLKRAVHRRAPKSFQCTTSMPVGFVSQRLTPRERQVALLVADRHTNPEIAQRLGLSSKTVAHHVAAVFERLGLRARWQVTHDLLKSNANVRDS